MSEEFIQEYNMFLSGEFSAVDTYELALQNVKNADIVNALMICKESHLKRVAKLTSCVEALGGKAAVSAGVWGPFAEWVQKSASSEIEAIALLEESEAERLVQYEAQQKIVVTPVLEVLTEDLLRPQHETHLTLSSLLGILREVPVAG